MIEKYIIVESNDSSLPRLKIDNIFIGKSDFIKWLSENFKFLDQEDLEKEVGGIAQDANFGANESERIGKLNQAKNISLFLDGTAFVISMWAWIKPYPYAIACLSCAFFPIVVIVFYRLYKGLLKLNVDAKSAYPNVSIAISMPIVVLFIRALLDYKLLDYNPIWIPTILIAITAVIVLVVGANKVYQIEPNKNVLLVGIAFCSLMYGFGVSVWVNCYFDNLDGTVYQVKVLSKGIDHGKITYYDLELSSWGPINTLNEVTVSKKLYDRIEKDDFVLVNLKPGKFGAPWFTVSK